MPADDSTAPPRDAFDPSQPSLVFINTCFGFAFASLFFIFDGLFQGDLAKHMERLWWLFLPTYLILKVWDKYRSYYIPLQVYSGELGSLWDEGTTYCITLCLGLIGLSAAKATKLVLPLLALLIALTILKTRQMKQVLQTAPHKPVVALDEVAFQARMLYIDMLLVTILLIYLFSAGRDLADGMFAFIAGLATVAIHRFADLVYRICHKSHANTSVRDYINSLRDGWRQV